MNTFKCVIIALSMVIMLAFCACAGRVGVSPVSPEEAKELYPEITVCPGQNDKLLLVTYDRETGEYGYPEPYYHYIWETAFNGTTTCEPGEKFVDILPQIMDSLPRISSSCEIEYELPDLCRGRIIEAVVYLTFQPYIETAEFRTFKEARTYAEAHLEEQPVIELIMRYSDRYVAYSGYEKGEEGCAFMLVP